jgi:protein involved in ribonucleotide reduction
MRIGESLAECWKLINTGASEEKESYSLASKFLSANSEPPVLYFLELITTEDTE